MIHERHPAVAAALVEHLENPGTPCLQAVASAARDLTGVGEFEPPSRRELMMGARPEPREPEEFEPGTTRDGWRQACVTQLARAKARRETQLMGRRAEQGWRLRWVPFSHVLRLRLWRPPCWSCRELAALMATYPLHMTWWECRFAGLAR